MIALNAEKYRDSGFEQAYFDEVYRYLYEKMDYATSHADGDGRVVKELVWCLMEYDLLQSLLSEETKGKNYRELTDDDVKSIIKALILADAGTLRSLYEVLHKPSGKYAREFKLAKAAVAEKRKNKEQANLDEPFRFLEYFGKKAYEGMRNLEISVPQVSAVREKIPILMIQALGIRTCPYCNRTYIGSSKGKILNVQLDHFYSKSRYPFFAVSLYNLVPSCPFCNLNKSSRDIVKLMSPFDKAYSFDESVRFVLEEVRKETEGEETQKTQELHFEVVAENPEDQKRYQTAIKEFQLETAYSFHCTEARQFTDKMRAYPPSLLRELARHISGADISDTEKVNVLAEALEMAFFQEYFCEPKDYIKKPLAKFYRDLYYKYRGWD